MEDPQYKPMTWVVFEYGSGRRFGQILGGSFTDGSWLYYINNPQDKVFLVKEEAISHEIYTN